MQINQAKVMKVLANEIRAAGIDIDDNDAEKLIDFYERIIITSSSEEGCDNTKPLTIFFDPYAEIDFKSMGAEGVESIKDFFIGINTLASDNEDTGIYHPFSDKTVNALGVDLSISGNILVALDIVQKFMHFIGGIGETYAESGKVIGVNNIWRLFSYPDKGRLRIFAYTGTDDSISFRIESTCIVDS